MHEAVLINFNDGYELVQLSAIDYIIPVSYMCTTFGTTYLKLSWINRQAEFNIEQDINDLQYFYHLRNKPLNIATTQPTTQNNLKQLYLGWYYYR